MISKELAKAREYEKDQESLISREDRPAYHFTARTGWLNDPNGLSFYNGEYHLFYQYHPYSTYWGPMHWGHAVSSDLIKWKYLPAAMAPDTEYDKSGCFSGTAVTLDDGRHLLVYTSCGDSAGDPTGRGRWLQTQSLAILNDNNEYVKYAGNPVIAEIDLPEDADPYEFRDPFVWKAGDGTYRMLAASGRASEAAGREHDGGTYIIMYRSRDGLNWGDGKVFFEDDRRIGVMWECPNFFPLGGRHVLIASPMDMKAEEGEAVGSIRFPKGNNVCYIIGKYDESSESFIPDTDNAGRYRYEPVDGGLDFYAPQVFLAPDGRRIMIGWMQDPKPANTESNGRRHSGIFGQMTVPRELGLKDGRLIQIPVREIEAYRTKEAVYSSVSLTETWKELEGIRGRVMDISLEISYQASCDNFAMRFAADGTHFTELRMDCRKSLIAIDRSSSGLDESIPSERTIKVRDCNGSIRLRILLDRWSAEIFINDGEQVISMTYYTDLSAKDILFKANGEASMDIIAYTLAE